MWNLENIPFSQFLDIPPIHGGKAKLQECVLRLYSLHTSFDKGVQKDYRRSMSGLQEESKLCTPLALPSYSHVVVDLHFIEKEIEADSLVDLIIFVLFLESNWWWSFCWWYFNKIMWSFCMYNRSLFWSIWFSWYKWLKHT